VHRKYLIKTIAAETGITQKQAREVLNTLEREYKNALKMADVGTKINILGLGSIKIYESSARTVYSPIAKRTIKCEATKRFKLKPSKKLINYINSETSTTQESTEE